MHQGHIERKRLSMNKPTSRAKKDSVGLHFARMNSHEDHIAVQGMRRIGLQRWDKCWCRKDSTISSRPILYLREQRQKNSSSPLDRERDMDIYVDP